MHVTTVMVIRLTNQRQFLLQQKPVVRCAKNPLEHEVCRFAPLVMLFSFNKNVLNAYCVLVPLSSRTLTGQRENIKSICTISLNYRWQVRGRLSLHFLLLSPDGPSAPSHWSQLTSSSTWSCRLPPHTPSSGDLWDVADCHLFTCLPWNE